MSGMVLWHIYTSQCLVHDTAESVSDGTLDRGGEFAGYALGRLYRFAHELADAGAGVDDVREMLRCGLELGQLRAEARQRVRRAS
jgi:hypothetical protein